MTRGMQLNSEKVWTRKKKGDLRTTNNGFGKLFLGGVRKKARKTHNKKKNKRSY